MPTTDDEEPRGRPLLKLLFWAGIGLAPIAMLLLLLADGNGPLRIAAVLAVLAVVLIGLSIGLRSDSDALRGELEDMVADEIDGLQGDVRRDIETAARATHRQLGEKLQALQQTVDAMRAQLDAQRAGPRPPSVGVPTQSRDAASAAVTYGAARESTARESVGAGRGEGATYGAARADYGRDSADDDRSAAQPAMAAGGRTYGGSGESQPGTARTPRGRMPSGVVRHTETVQVTTRHTVVDGRGGTSYGTGDIYGDDNRYRDDSRYRDDNRYGDDDRQGGRRSADYSGGTYGGGSYSGGSYSGGSYGSRREPDEDTGYRGRRSRDDDDAEPTGYDAYRGQAADWQDPRDGEESFTDRRLRELRGDRPAIERGDDPVLDPQWSSARAGDRWASVRADDQGRELRMGERRASVRADESGTEYRVEDRWAAVRRDDDDRSPSRRDEDRAGSGAGPDQWYADAWSDSRSRTGSTYGATRDDAGDDWRRSGGARALPQAHRDESWGRGAYDDDRGGDDRWR
ncbi:hypothetical protein O7635_11285 [Asanoa sp. WMMD1127]|uniref:hypothetical protein n=1 Tax=Asanoa sp. WMMD1127 TaxID=3016107 RepID=UPI0024177118|nr:hypothetical protein [Asanoa sp. WMMD1127]MDG4822432.1 hypothetical protein [Asanoa sp. WMMD1127]